MSSESRQSYFGVDRWLGAGLLKIARSLVFLRPVVPYPGWRFDAEWDNPRLAFRLRRRIWSYFRNRRVEASILMPWHGGTQIWLYLGNDLSKQVFVGGCNEPNELALLVEILRPGMVFVDAGAHEGAFSVLAASLVGPSGRVLAFEPSEREFGRLKRNLELNGLGNVTAYRAALSDRSGEAELLIADGEHSGQNTLGGFVHRDVGLLRRQTVELRTLDEIVKDAGLDHVDVIKIDVEGAESHVLRGSARILREMRPVVIFEVLEAALARQGSSVGDLRQMFSSAGYALFGFDDATGRLAPAKGYGGNLVAAPTEVRFLERLCPAADPPGGRAASFPSGAGAASRAPAERKSPASGGAGGGEPYLSVVAASRNDDHGGELLRRMQIFVDAFVSQCNRYSLSAELILVEWNPPPDRPPLADALSWPEEQGPCRVRIIEVPAHVHRRYRHADSLPLYQMIAKNAGLRRARGRFVLATNIDIVFSEELVRFFAAGQLQRGRMYRIDRHDVMADVPVNLPLEEQLDYCRTHILRVNTREGTFATAPDGRIVAPKARVAGSAAYAHPPSGRLSSIMRTVMRLALGRGPVRFRVPYSAALVRKLGLRTDGGGIIVDTGTPRLPVASAQSASNLHTNACGDFTLMEREHWLALRGYPEFDAYSFNIDSILCFAAHYAGVREEMLTEPMRIYHIEHGLGSGWTPEGQAKLFERLAAKGIPYVEWSEVTGWAEQMRRLSCPMIFNDDRWGLADIDLRETIAVPGQI